MRSSLILKRTLSEGASWQNGKKKREREREREMGRERERERERERNTRRHFMIPSVHAGFLTSCAKSFGKKKKEDEEEEEEEEEAPR